MNRYKKEESLKRDKIRNGLTINEIKVLDRKNEILELARSIHIERYGEEYDFQLDSIADAKDRARGINPMNEGYIAKVNAKRIKEGVTPLSNAGLAVSDDSFKIAYVEAEAIVRDRNPK